MSIIDDVRSADRRLEELLGKLKRVGADDPDDLFGQLRKARDEYAKSVRELEAILDPGARHFPQVHWRKRLRTL